MRKLLRSLDGFSVASPWLKKLLSGAFLSYLLRFGAVPQNSALLAYFL
jgi:hypothetical protein